MRPPPSACRSDRELRRWSPLPLSRPVRVHSGIMHAGTEQGKSPPKPRTPERSELLPSSPLGTPSAAVLGMSLGNYSWLGEFGVQSEYEAGSDNACREYICASRQLVGLSSRRLEFVDYCTLIAVAIVNPISPPGRALHCLRQVREQEGERSACVAETHEKQCYPSYFAL